MIRRARPPLSFLPLLILLLVIALAAWQWRAGPPVSGDLTALLPAAEVPAREQQAIQRMQDALNQDLLLLVSADDRAEGARLARLAATALEQSGRFETVRAELQVSIAALRDEVLAGRLALLAADDRQQLESAPAQWLQQRARSLLDAFGGTGPIAARDDWLGLAQKILQSHGPTGKTGLDLNSGLVVAEDAGRSWYLVHGRASANAFDSDQAADVSAELARVRTTIEAAGGRLLATSGLLYGAESRARANQEMSWLGSAALLGIAATLLLAFRRWQALLVLVPVLVGLLTGITACVLVFGKVHAMTLVIGSTLIGVATDYPLHYLCRCYHDAGRRRWRPWAALRAVRPGLRLSLATSLIGYAALGLTPFPALTQLAVFSGAGLIAAYACTVLLIPRAFPLHTAPRPWLALLSLARWLLGLQSGLRTRLQGRPRRSWALGLALVAILLAGSLQVRLGDNLRDWVRFPAGLVAESRQIATITGHQPASQFFLVTAASESALLERLAALSTRLATAREQGLLQDWRSLDQLLASPEAQQRLRGALGELARSPDHWQPLLALGVPAAAITAELTTLQALPDRTIDQVLAGPLAEPWRALWLGPGPDGVAAMVTLSGVPVSVDTSAFEALAATLTDTRWVDRVSGLNAVFASARNQAIWLKLAATIAVFALLSPLLGPRSTVRLLAVPLLAVAATLALLGWLAWPLTLFGLFGMLLVTAIGVDYAIFMRAARTDRAAGVVSILLAATTTALSFGLLVLSATPAVRDFGFSVSAGIVFCFLLAPWLVPGEVNEVRS